MADLRRDQVQEFLQQLGPPQDDDDHGEVIHEGAVLTGWVVVCEWMAPDGERWLSRGWAPSKAAWEAAGMMHYALDENQWNDEDSDA